MAMRFNLALNHQRYPNMPTAQILSDGLIGKQMLETLVLGDNNNKGK